MNRIRSVLALALAPALAPALALTASAARAQTNLVAAGASVPPRPGIRI